MNDFFQDIIDAKNQRNDDEIYEAEILNWDYINVGTIIPAIRYKTYTLKLPDGRIYRIKEKKRLNSDVGDVLLLIVPAGNWNQAYISTKIAYGTTTVPNTDHIEFYKMK